jgi:molybdenum cofactor biosynthesis protein B
MRKLRLLRQGLKAHEHHREASPRKIGIYVVTVSSSRYRNHSRGRETSDESGDVIVKAAAGKGHRIIGRTLISDDSKMIRSALNKALRARGVDAVIMTGGTGLSDRDITVETVKPLLSKMLEGFGEIFRSLTYQEIGSPAFLTRATAGKVGRKLVFCLPGSPNAAELGMRLILPELPHAVMLARS